MAESIFPPEETIKPSKTPLEIILSPFTALFSVVYHAFIGVIDLIMTPLQKRLGVNGMAYVFVLPNLLIFGVFILLPMLLNFYYAFTGGTQLLPENRPFVAAENFERLFTCGDFLNPNSCSQDRFWRAVFNTTTYVFFEVTLMVALALLTALALNKNIRGRGFFRSVFFYPVLLSPVVVALIWKWILQRDGLLNAILVGVGVSAVNFLTSPDWARLWVIIIAAWSQMGFYTLILLAGLQSIPHELYEAAQIDGANQPQTFSAITMPLLMPTMLVVLVLALIRAVQVFDIVFAFTGGGPGTSTYYMVQYIYNTAFTNQTREYGIAAAASVTLAVVLFAFTIAQLRLGRTSAISE